MKVYIGPYKSWFGPYQIANLLKYVGLSEDDCHIIGHKLAETKLNNFCQWIDKLRTRKTKIQIHDYDTWNMDGTLAMIVLPMLKQLKETAHGAPACMPEFGQTSNQVQYSFKFYDQEDDKAWKDGFEHWKAILDEMIWSFEQLQPECEEEFTFHKDGKFDVEGFEKYNQRIDNGLKLFGQYYRNLWD
jgi:hypothetical protein